jgi:alkylhydroperoxidase family enzyme
MVATRSELLAALRRSVVEESGTLDPAVRGAAARGGPVDGPAAELVEKVRRHAYRVTDTDIAALRGAGYSEDQIYELTIAAALGEGTRRLAIVDALLAEEGVRRHAP